MASKVVFINQFDGGMTNDPRDPRPNVCRTCEHFDTFTNRFKLTPYRDTESGDSSASTNQIANFVYYGGVLYGLGTVLNGGFTQPCIFQKTDVTSSTWSNIASSGVSPAGRINTGANRLDAETAAFAYYPLTGKLYGVGASQYVWSITVGSSTNATAKDLTSYSTVSNMVVHSKTNILYLGYDNKIAANSNDTWTAPALTLPANYVITSLCEYGNYLAIGCRSSDRRHSVVYLWDMNATAVNVTDTINWGEGELFAIEELDGYLIGMSMAYQTAGTTLDNTMMINTRTTFASYTSTYGAVPFCIFTGNSTNPAISASIALSRHKINNRLYIPASIPIGTTGYQGIWAISKSSEGVQQSPYNNPGYVPFSVTLDRFIDNGTTVGGLYGSFLLGDYMFMAYTLSSTFTMDKTNHSTSYTATSLYETTINPNMALPDRPLKKQLEAVGLTYESIPTGGKVVLKYRVDGGAWTTVFTEQTAGVVATEPVTFDAAGANFTSGREYEFHIESTGGVEITGIQYKYSPLVTNLS